MGIYFGLYLKVGELGFKHKLFASLNKKKLISLTPLADALNALIFALKDSAAALVLLLLKKFNI